MSIFQSLKQYNEHHPSALQSEAEKETEITQALRVIYKERQEQKVAQNSTYQTIPRFFFKKDQSSDPILKNIRIQARQKFFQRKNETLFDTEDLEELRKQLLKYESPPLNCKTPMINYDDFCCVGEIMKKMREGSAEFFKPSVFLLHTKDYLGRISIDEFFYYVNRKIQQHYTHITLSLFDGAGLGFLTEMELEGFFYEQIPLIPDLKKMDPDFHQFYLCTASRKFFFFLDPSKKNKKVSIWDVLRSTILAEFEDLKNPDLYPEQIARNWFSYESAIRIYEEYLEMDVDRNGMISRSELAPFSNYSLTPLFLDRVFEETHTYEGEMDYKTYLDFVLAMKYAHTPQGLMYIFQMIDTRHRGYLTTFDLGSFFKDVHSKLDEQYRREIRIEDVVNEIFDMVHPLDPLKITLTDLLECGQGGTVLAMLINVQEFIRYDTRESQPPDNADSDF